MPPLLFWYAARVEEGGIRTNDPQVRELRKRKRTLGNSQNPGGPAEVRLTEV